MGHYYRVHGTGACRAHPLHLDTRLFKQSIEHAPSKGAMGATTLESQVDALHLRDCRSELPGERLLRSFRRMRIYRRSHVSSHCPRPRMTGMKLSPTSNGLRI